ncbi:hypothetical protein SEA_AVOCADO_35 [Mycobacterium phage Avocado]|uniref:Uncharacterized protein n=1 Tax=Mycobacterium phage Avocado TaxID=2024302 RepID=A0A222YZW0_9CAUD|nr:hypothetical protein KDW73_gp35 [Mycobacterium phage Avocado]ASR77237.1 hypothetical protein SEA_AVOCADO_35 [Mycobacterium phage Avocado]
MTTQQGIIVGTIIGALSLVAIVAEPPAWAIATFGWIAGNFRRGRHHLHAPLPARPFERERLTVAALAGRLEAEARRPRLVPRKYGRGYIAIEPDASGFSATLARVLDELDAGRGIADAHAGIAG